MERKRVGVCMWVYVMLTFGGKESECCCTYINMHIY